METGACDERENIQAHNKHRLYKKIRFLMQLKIANKNYKIKSSFFKTNDSINAKFFVAASSLGAFV